MPVQRPTPAAPSCLVDAGNGDKFLFDNRRAVASDGDRPISECEQVRTECRKLVGAAFDSSDAPKNHRILTTGQLTCFGHIEILHDTQAMHALAVIVLTTRTELALP